MIIERNCFISAKVCQTPSFGAKFEATEEAKQQLEANIMPYYEGPYKENHFFRDYAEFSFEKFFQDLKNKVEDITLNIKGKIGLVKGDMGKPFVTFDPEKEASPEKAKKEAVWEKARLAYWTGEVHHVHIDGFDLLPNADDGDEDEPQLHILMGVLARLEADNTSQQEKKKFRTLYDELIAEKCRRALDHNKECKTKREDI